MSILGNIITGGQGGEGSGGETNTGSNVGTGAGVFNGKSGTTLQFRSLKAGGDLDVRVSGLEVVVSGNAGGAGGFTEASADSKYLKLSNTISATSVIVSGNIKFDGYLTADANVTFVAGNNLFQLFDNYASILIDGTSSIQLGDNSFGSTATLDIGKNLPFGQISIGTAGVGILELKGYQFNDPTNTNQLLKFDGSQFVWVSAASGFTKASADALYAKLSATNLFTDRQIIATSGSGFVDTPQVVFRNNGAPLNTKIAGLRVDYQGNVKVSYSQDDDNNTEQTTIINALRIGSNISRIDFHTNKTLAASVGQVGTAVSSQQTIITSEKGDARYQPIGNYLTEASANVLYLSANTPVGGGGSSTNWIQANNGDNFSIAPIASGASSIAIGQRAISSSLGANSIVIGTSAFVSAEASIAFGLRSQSRGTNSIAIGRHAYASNVNAIAIGTSAIASNQTNVTLPSIAIGQNVFTSANYSTVIGYDSQAGESGVSIGWNVIGTSQGTVAIGQGVSARGSWQVAIGREVTVLAGAQSGVAIGYQSRVASSNAVSIGPGANAGSGALQIRVNSASNLEMTATGQLSTTGTNAQYRLANYASGARPTPLGAGSVIFDTTLLKAILWNGTAWVNMDGTAL